ncbi:T-kininogen 1-like isoform X2 [Apodemus sylvaticus]|uniref:T-kininogen 1-like isoform X2 n=1 Tax=Apodemus sylvaticus TaxID=10129 RepID=UPI002244BD06|nr:T-kininogen 1-like isoform X2 [Apodemus sylvaticus]
MKLITILLLCSRLLPSLVQITYSQEIECIDETVFQAADTALKKYNSGLQSGNQFVLYRVAEGTKTDGLETIYNFKYQIKEGNCSVQSGLDWQDCDFKNAEEAATGECTATVGKRENKFSVARQTCNITPGKRPTGTDDLPCMGCVSRISTESPELEPILKHAIEHFNNNTDHSHLFALREVKSAHSQVVAGTIFDITYSIVQTNCSKDHFPSLLGDCVSLPNGDDGECRGNVVVNIDNKIADFSQTCDLYPGHGLLDPLSKNCRGCPKEIPVDSPELKEALGHSIAQLNAENNHTFYFKIDTVKKATSQVVAGAMYVIEFIARETKCSKESNTELTAECEVNHLGQSLNCKANVYMRPWENKVFPTVKCQPLQMNTMMRRPPGFSPFRSVRVQETKGGITKYLPTNVLGPHGSQLVGRIHPQKQQNILTLISLMPFLNLYSLGSFANAFPASFPTAQAQIL